MELYYALIALSYAAICGVGGMAYFLWRKETDKVSIHFALFSIAFALPLLMNAFWATGYLLPSSQDAMLINGAFYVVASVLTLLIMHDLTGNKYLLYLLGLFGISFAAMAYSFSNFFIAVLIISGLLSLIASLDVLIVKRYHIQYAGIIGTIYSLASLAFFILSYLGMPFTKLWWFIPNLLFALFLYMLHLDKKYYALIRPELETEQRPHIKKVYFGLNFLRYTLYVGAVASFVFISTVAVHELGHAATAYYYGCEHAEIRYNLVSAPFTEIICPEKTELQIAVITGMGLLSVIGVSLIFFFTEGQFTTRLAYLMVGYGLMTFYHDSMDLGASESLATLMLLISFMIIMHAIIRFALFYIKEHTREIEIEDRTRPGHTVRRAKN